MAHLDGVKAPLSHKKKVNHAHVRAKKMAPEKCDDSAVSVTKKKEARRTDDLSHLSIDERKRLMWIGVIVVMVAVIGVWIWLLPTSWRVTAQRTDAKDWNKLKENLSKTFDEFQTKTSKENEQLEKLRQNVFGNENANTNGSIDANSNNNINDSGQVAGEENNANAANENLNTQNKLPLIENINVSQ